MKTVFVIFLIGFLLLGLSSPKKKARVAVIDSGLDITDTRFSPYLCPDESKDFTGTGLEDHMGHGSHISGLIIKYAKNANFCLIILKYTNLITDSPEQNTKNLNSLYYYLYQVNPDVVNFSGGGDTFLETEALAIRDLKDTKFFVAAGNENKNIDKYLYYPASLNYPNIFAIAALDNYIKASFSDWGNKVIWMPGVNILSTVPYSIDKSGMMYMSGTSQSTAIYTSEYLNKYY